MSTVSMNLLCVGMGELGGGGEKNTFLFPLS